MMSGSLDEVLKHSNVVVKAISHISKSSEAQAVSTSQVSKAIEYMSTTIQNNSSATEESALIAEDLLNQSNTLRELLSGFRFSN